MYADHERGCVLCFWWEAERRKRYRGETMKRRDLLRSLTETTASRCAVGCEEGRLCRVWSRFANAERVGQEIDLLALWDERRCVVDGKKKMRHGDEKKLAKLGAKRS